MTAAGEAQGAKVKVMISSGDPAIHEEAWSALPWLANGRLSHVERDKIEPHVRDCTACREELALQRLLCNALTEPDRVTYAPGPSFRKLMERIDGTAPQTRRASEQPRAVSTPARSRNRGWGSLDISLWRPPGLAWAASFVLMVGLAGIVTSVYRQSQPNYTTHTDTAAIPANVLHIAFNRSVTIGEAEEVLHSTGAHIVEGPDNTGIFGVAPGAAGSNATPEHATRDLRVLSARLRADPRVRWVQPVPGDDSPGVLEGPTPRGP
jgi:hypothetical protein